MRLLLVTKIKEFMRNLDPRAFSNQWRESLIREKPWDRGCLYRGKHKDITFSVICSKAKLTGAGMVHCQKLSCFGHHVNVLGEIRDTSMAAVYMLLNCAIFH